MTKAQADVVNTLASGGQLMHDRRAQRISLTWGGAYSGVHLRTLTSLLRDGHVRKFKEKAGVVWYVLAAPPISTPE
jgi:hypothetical protein